MSPRVSGTPGDGSLGEFQAPQDWIGWKELLAARGFQASRRWGQNFLFDENMLRALVSDAELSAGGFVLEIGAGLGTLSRKLAESGASLLAVEIDARLAPIARAMLAPFPKTRLLEADALDGKHALNSELAAALPKQGPWQVVANLPYSVACPLLVLLARRACAPTSISVLVQWEVAERIAARPGEPAWGGLAARLQPLYRARIVRKLPPQVFWPRPEVDSALLRLERRLDRAEPAPEDLVALDRLVDLLFQARRKSLRAVLGRALGQVAPALAWLERQGLDPLRRGESLVLAELEALAQDPCWREWLEKQAGKTDLNNYEQ